MPLWHRHRASSTQGQAGKVTHTNFRRASFSRRKQFERITQTFRLRLFPFRRVNPADVPPPIRWRQLLEVLPGRCVRLQRLHDVGRDRRHRRPWRIAAPAGGRTLQPSFCQQSTFLQVRISSAICSRPSIVDLPRREQPRVPVCVKTSDEAVDPPKAQRLLNRVVIAERGAASVTLVEDKPDRRVRVVVRVEPAPPCRAARHAKGLDRLWRAP